jgi:hypothetical protein
VSQALDDLRILIDQSGYGSSSAIDRVHTALHAHLLFLCKARGLNPSENAGTTALFKLIRKALPTEHDLFASLFGNLSGLLGSLDSLRNNQSMAHPSEAILDEPEARLTLNVGKALLQYLNDRFPV